MEIPFCSSLRYPEITPFDSIKNFIETYFSLSGKVTVIQSDGITAFSEDYTPSYLEVALKIFSYITLVIPLIVCIAKVALRLYSSPIIWIPQSSAINNLIKEQFPLLPPLYWLPHPKFETADLTQFPHDKVNFLTLNRNKELVSWFGREKTMQMITVFLENPLFGQNDFLKWLNDTLATEELTQSVIPKQIEESGIFNLFGYKEHFMNCVDFVYFNLHQAGLISKEQIIAHYRAHITQELSGACSFYGFPLNRFQDFDPTKEAPKPGDLILGYMEGKPVHILFLSGRNLSTGEWKGIGLWNMGTKVPTVTDTELTKLQQDCHNNKQTLTFKYCSLETALKTMTR